MTYILELAREKGKRIKMLDDYALFMIKPREGILKYNGTTLPKEQAAVLQDGCRALNDYITQQRVREMKEIKGRLKGRCERPGTAIHQRSKPLKTNPAFPHQPLMTTKRPQQRQQQQAKPKTTPT